MKITGFVNGNGYFPTPLTSVSLDEFEMKAHMIYSNGERYYCDITQEQIDKLIPNKTGYEEVENAYAYAFSEESIIYGTNEEVLIAVRKMLDGDEIDAKSRRIMNLFYESAKRRMEG